MGLKVNDQSGGASAGGGHALVNAVVTSAPTDAAFDVTPPDGATVVLDNEDGTGDIYVRVNGGTWLKITNASA